MNSACGSPVSFSTSLETEPLRKSSKTAHDRNFKVSHETSTQQKVITGPRTMPTRHSRHHIPPIAPFFELQSLTDEILQAKPGSLFVYDPSKNSSLTKVQQYDFALQTSDNVRQKIEYLLRGYSALLPRTIIDISTYEQDEESDDKNKTNPTDTAAFVRRMKISHIPDEEENPVLYKKWLDRRNEVAASFHIQREIIQTMEKLVTRLENEGEIYVDMWSKHRSSRMTLMPSKKTATGAVNDEPEEARSSSSDEDSSSSDSDGEDGNIGSDAATPEEKIAWRMEQFIKSFGAPPGPSIHMYDLVLDAMAVAIEHCQGNPTEVLQAAKSWQRRAIERFTMDLNAKMEQYNYVPTAPTPLTYNALIRIAALAPYNNNNPEMRDVAIDLAFSTYDGIYRRPQSDFITKLLSPTLGRNSATYQYMLKMIAKYFPISATRGNIAHALFVKAAVEEGVLDEHVFDALLNDVSPPGVSHGEKFDKWASEVRERYNMDHFCYGFPSKWSMNKRSRRYNKRYAFY